MDKTGKPTGEGKVREVVVSRNPIFARIDLYNYNIDGNNLKPRHQEYLRQKIVPLLHKAPIHAKLVGRTSRSGDSAYNQQLSVERVLRVKQFLMSTGLPESKVPGSQMQATGESRSTSDSNEAEAERSVTLTLAYGVKNRPIIPNQVVPEMVIVIPAPGKKPTPGSVPVAHWRSEAAKGSGRKTSRQFKIMHLGSVGVSPGAGHLFRIVDKTNNMETMIVMAGGNVGVDLAPVTGKGKWVDFSTSDPHDLTEFGSTSARFTESPGALWFSATDNFLTFGNEISSPQIRVKSGVTIGVTGGSVTTGPTTTFQAPIPYVRRPVTDFVTLETTYE